jgi:hypothetical protein
VIPSTPINLPSSGPVVAPEAANLQASPYLHLPFFAKHGARASAQHQRSGASMVPNLCPAGAFQKLGSSACTLGECKMSQQISTHHTPQGVFNFRLIALNMQKTCILILVWISGAVADGMS